MNCLLTVSWRNVWWWWWEESRHSWDRHIKGSIWNMWRSTQRAERKPQRSQGLKGSLAESRQSSASGHSIAYKIATPGSAFPRITPFLRNTGLLHFECWVRSTLNPVCVKNNSYLLNTNHDAHRQIIHERKMTRQPINMPNEVRNTHVHECNQNHTRNLQRTPGKRAMDPCHLIHI